MKDYFPVECASTLQWIGLMMRSARLSQGIRQSDLASRLGVAEKMLRRVERGDPSVSVRAFMLVLWQLGVTEQIVRSIRATPVSFQALEEKTSGRRVRRKKRSERVSNGKSLPRGKPAARPATEPLCWLSIWSWRSLAMFC